jgi:hypothetical protein
VGRARAVLNNANLTAELRSGLWTECGNYVSQMHNVTVKAGRTMCPHEEFFGKKPNFLKSLKIFGEVCVRTVRKGRQDKLENKGDLCLLIGCPKDHYHDTFRLFNLDTRKVVESMDFTWLNQMYRKEGEESNLVAVVSDPNEPKTFHQAWNHKDLTEEDGWRSAIQVELANIDKRNVW